MNHRIITEIKLLRKNIELQEPSLRQYEERGSAPFYCTLCKMSELQISDNKKDDKFFCGCSYWSDPHNAYEDKSGGKWLGWKNQEYAKNIVNNEYNYENGYNNAIEDVLDLLNSYRSLCPPNTSK